MPLHRISVDGTNTDIGGVAIVLGKKKSAVTVTGTVNSSDGNPVTGASVSGGGAMATTDAGCCDKNVQITVADCDTAADDIFLVLSMVAMLV